MSVIESTCYIPPSRGECSAMLSYGMYFSLSNSVIKYLVSDIIDKYKSTAPPVVSLGQ